MAVKILLADKSITIQKVVEMLFSGREYQVVCVSDGEAALSEATRSSPDVVLADVDLPRIDGYTLAARFKQAPSLARTPVILMLSRDDVFDVVRAQQAGILDKIAKPFESQDLIGKVRKALASAPSRPSEPARPAAAQPAPAGQPRPKQAAPSDIFDIIREAPSQADVRRAAAPPREDSIFEVEPVVEMEEPMAREVERALPIGQKAVEEMRAGLGLTERTEQAPPAFTSFESFGADAQEFAPSRPEPAAAAPLRRAPERGMPQTQPSGVSDEMLRGVAEETVSRIAREVLEKVAWEVIPDLAERLIREEIERLKAGT